MNIVFMGTPEFAVKCGEAIRRSAHRIVAVVTVPDKPAGRGLALRASAVKQWAIEHQLPVYQPLHLKDPEFLNVMRAAAPDVIVVVAFRILPRELYAIPAKGAFN